MLKRTIKYTNFNDQEVTDIFYFNLSKSELVEMELSTKEGFGEMLQRIIESKDNTALVATFKRLILSAYGKKSPDGERFEKNDQLREEFSQTAAYQALFMELATDDNAAVIFIRGIIPSDMGPSLETQINEQLADKAKETGLPGLPPPVVTKEEGMD